MLNQPYSRVQFALFRVIFGLYLTNHFRELSPYVTDLYSNQGMLPDPALNFTYWLTPNPLYYFDTPLLVQSLCGLAIILSLLFTFGFARRFSALLLWIIWAMFFNRNVLTSNPSVSFVGFLLLVSVLVPPGERLTEPSAAAEPWHMPRELLFVVWLVMAASYSVSGVLKLASPSWLSGDAILFSIDQIHARDSFLREIVLHAPTWALHILTWITLAGELLFLFLLPSFYGRALCWWVMCAMHCALLLLLTFYDLSLGMLMVHLFTFDERWLIKRKDT